MKTAIDADRPLSAEGSRSTRRQFLKRAGFAGAAGFAASVAGFNVFESTADAAQGIVEPVYAVDSVPEATVFLSQGRRFNVVVKNLDGKVIERHRRIRARQLMRIESPYFDAYEVTAPMATY